MKVLVFDMDGTIADLYGVEDWLSKLRAEDASPYEEAKAIYDADTLNLIIEMLKERGWRIAVTSWLAMDSTKEYDKRVRQAKREWLDRQGFPYDEIHLVKYGTRKANCTKRHGGYQVLVDDNAEVRDSWKLGKTINANNNIIKELINLLIAD